MPSKFPSWIACVGLMMACGAAAQQPAPEELRQQVEKAERAFAQTMADRDFEAFGTHLSEEAVFFSGQEPLRGKRAVADAWQPLFEGPDAPFSWEPDTVVVLESGALALSSGPVRNPEGKRVATFNSIWRLDADGQWRVIFDKGSRDCEDPAPADGE